MGRTSTATMRAQKATQGPVRRREKASLVAWPAPAGPQFRPGRAGVSTVMDGYLMVLSKKVLMSFSCGPQKYGSIFW